MKKFFKEQENKIAVFAFLVVMAIACSPLMTKLCINGHDLEYHLLRIESLKEGILMGRPLLKVNVLFFGGAGYASSMFYPDFLLYIAALLRAAGVGINASYHIFIAIIICLTYLSAYYCAKKMTGAVYPALIAAILMTFSPYFLGDIYIRSAVGEYSAFVFLPFVIYGIYNVLYENMDKPWILGIGFGGMILSHTATFIFCFIFAFAAFVIKWKVFKNRIKTLWTLLITAAVTAAITMFYWLPMLEQLLTTPLYVNDPWISLDQSAVRVANLFSSQFPSLGAILLLLALFRILVKVNPGNRNLISYADWLLVGGAVFSLLATDLVPWNRLNGYLDFIQFPWRLFIIATAMFAFADAIIVYCFIKSSLEPYMQSSLKVLTVLLLVIDVAVALSFINKADITYYDYSDDYYSYKPFTATVIAGEWLPKTVTSSGKLLEQSEHMTDDKGYEIDFSRVKNSVEAGLDGSAEYVDVPFVYYKGYKAVLLTKEGKKNLKVEASENNGLCRVYTERLAGNLVVSYAGTVLENISAVVSIVTLAGLLLFVLLRKKKLLLTAGSALILLSLVGCGESGEEMKIPEAPMESVSARQFMGLEDRAEDISFEHDYSEDYQLIINNEYASNAPKQVYFLFKDKGSDAMSEEIEKLRADIRVILRNDHAQSEQETEDVLLSEYTDKPLLLMDFSSLTDSGEYSLYVKVTRSDMPDTPIEIEKKIVIDANHYEKLLLREEKDNKQESDEIYAIFDRILTEEMISDENDDSTEESLFESTLEDRLIDLYENGDKADHFMAAAWLYKETGNREYRTETESFLKEVETSEQIPYLEIEKEIFYGFVAYLRTTTSTDYSLSTEVMEILIDQAIDLIERDKTSEWERLYTFDEEVRIEYGEQDVKLLLLANEIGKSVEYIDAARNYMNIIEEQTDSIFILTLLNENALFAINSPNYSIQIANNA